MKILIVTEYFPDSEKQGITGGVESRSYNIAKELAKKHDVIVLCSWQGQKRDSKVAGAEVIRCGSYHPYSSFGSMKSRLLFARSALRAGKKLKGLDIVEGHNFISYLPAYFIGKYHKIPKIATYHEVWVGRWIKLKGLVTGMFGSAWERYVLRRKWDRFIAVSNFCKKDLVKQGISAKKIDIVPNGVELSQFEKVKVKKYKNPTICCISRLTPNKRVGDLIKAVANIKKKIPNIRCKIIGTGDQLGKLKKLSLDLGLDKHVEFLGYVKKQEDVIKALKSSHVFCSPSVLEGFGIVVVEAMACRVPYVISNIEPFVEVTENGKGGLIFRRTDVSDLSHKLTRLFNDKKLYPLKIREGKSLVKQYDWKKIVEILERIYGRLK